MNEQPPNTKPPQVAHDRSSATPSDDLYPPDDLYPRRLRLYFRKGDAVRYISHLDMLRAWERAIRRSGLPLAYSQGFSPHPKITIAMPLAVGCTGAHEALDIILDAPTSESQAVRALTPVMPPGLSVKSAEEVDLKEPALATRFLQAVYDVLLVDIEGKEVQRRVDDLLQQERVPVEHRKKRFDLRPLIGSLALADTPPDVQYPHRATASRPDTLHPPITLRAVLLRNEQGRIGRPDVLLEALGLTEHARQLERVQVVYQATGGRTM